ncbi:hypothetical protein [Lewinella sp. W8]|uniref:hypothetical protein n=1 Tax=Lewinella sp. W8 TaxID=2528208 RepID=UPI001067A8EC|nr:hypothetical protein [Lewinella sp. W8]MTB50450.1 hypothetical protein [Lewinella sp. W8]
MKSTKIIQLLEQISPQMREDYLHFLRHRLPDDQQGIKLATTMVELINQEKDFPENKPAFFRRVFGNVDFTAKEINYVLSFLNQAGEDFLAWRSVESEEVFLSLNKLKQYSRLTLDKHFRAENKRVRRRLFSSGVKGPEEFLRQTQYFLLQDEHYIQNKIRREDNNLQLASDSLDAFYYAKKLQIACSLLDRQNILAGPIDHQITTDWLDQLEQSPASSEPIIQIYLTIFRALREPDREGYFWTLKEMLGKQLSVPNPEILREVTQFAINYCARKIRQGKQQFVREALALYRVGIENAWLLDNEGKLSPWAFTNVVKLSLREKEYTYAQHFIEEYEKQLPTEFRQNARNYNLAELLYYTDQKAAAQEYLQRVAYTDLNYYLGARVLLAKIYFETGEEEALLSHLAAFTIFLQRNKKISRNLQATFLNFCKILNSILRLRGKSPDALGRRIEETSLLTDREWLKNVALHGLPGG